MLMTRFFAVAFLARSLVFAQRPSLRKGDHDLGRLNLCEGDCDNDRDCKLGLSCFKRKGTQPVPGCRGKGVSGKDYCYDELRQRGSSLSLVSDSSERLDMCQGNCKSDDDCLGSLVCSRGNDTRPLRGCYGRGERGKNYCYKKDKQREKPNPTPTEIKHIGTTRMYYEGEEIYEAKVKIPDGAKEGDLLLLVLHRTDGFLPLGINGDFGNKGWTRAAECFTSGNVKDCATYMDCRKCVTGTELVGTNNLFCKDFRERGQLGKRTKGRGRDLSSVIFTKEAGPKELQGSRTIKINLNPDKLRTNPAWAFVSAIRGADTRDPIRDWNGSGVEEEESKHSIFPSVDGEIGDLLLLSQSFDQGAPGVTSKSFTAPKGFEEFVSMFDCLKPLSREKNKLCDEAGYLFGKILRKNGQTGEYTTSGTGAARKGDAMLALTIMPKGGARDDVGRGASEWLGTNGKNCPPNRTGPDDS